jgi:hypothetical protein
MVQDDAQQRAVIVRGISPPYSMKPSFFTLFRKKFTREPVVTPREVF